ncbi:MAG TPA: universal stress protein [Candidatus Dormibacteraeota bacterium]|nr:universal stress protein [Candidatus Dormibacteraeota bacterium]
MKVLVCHDGSPQAERALRLGATLGAACEAEVTLLGINEPGAKQDEALMVLKRGLALLEEKKVRAELVTKSGHALEKIVHRTEETSYDLVVIGAVRKGTRGAFWMSSKTYKIIKAIKPPVLAVSGKIVTVKRMLICTGGKPPPGTSLAIAGRIASGLGASITLLHVMPDVPAIYSHLPRMEEDTARLLASKSELGVHLRHLKEGFEAGGIATEVRLRDGPVLAEILSEIQEGDYDLVVTGSAPSRSLRTYVLGDISREIVNRTNCAVLVVRSEAKPAASPFTLRRWFGRSERKPVG